MALFLRVYYHALAGGLGGLLGWMLFGLFGDAAAPQDRLAAQLLLGGATLGGVLGYFVASVDAVRDRSLARFCRLACYGAALGALGGALGLALGDWVNFRLVALVGAGRRGGPDALNLAGAMLARALGWMLLGGAVGLAEGAAFRSLRKVSYGTLGGALGGFVGGALFGLLYRLTLDRPGAASLWGALGLVILGACIGALSALVQAVLQPASLRVLRGWQEGREFGLDKAETVIGRDERADIALFRDMKVEKKHALIRRTGEQFVLINAGAPPELTQVNGEPVPTERPLQDGDRLQLGTVLLRFQARAAGALGAAGAARAGGGQSGRQTASPTPAARPAPAAHPR